jgi:hypothetical protein
MALVHLHLSFAKLEFIVIIVAWILQCISARHLVAGTFVDHDLRAFSLNTIFSQVSKATTPLLDGGSQHTRMAAMNLSIAYFSLSK